MSLERTDLSVTLCPAVVDKYPGSQSIWRAEKIDESALYKGFDNSVVCCLERPQLKFLPRVGSSHYVSLASEARFMDFKIDLQTSNS